MVFSFSSLKGAVIMETIQLLTAELVDHSYLNMKLEAKVSVVKNNNDEKSFMIYRIGRIEEKVEEGIILKQTNETVVYGFSTLVKKDSGLLANGLEFSFSTDSFSGGTSTSNYQIGGVYGNFILEGLSIKHHMIYFHNQQITGSVLIRPQKQIQCVRLVMVNLNIVKEAKFKEKLPYSDIEVWEYEFVNPSNLSGKLQFFVEFFTEEKHEIDNCFENYYTIELN
jgi:hypothetical protein